MTLAAQGQEGVAAQPRLGQPDFSDTGPSYDGADPVYVD
jgi:hypothetical protein